MSGRLEEQNGHRIWVVGDDGPSIGEGQDALDLIGDALGYGADGVVVPVGRLKPEFLQLRSGLAGEFIQKLINYRLWFAVIGDVSEAVDRSEALRDFVRESNRGRHVFFMPDRDALLAKLGPARN